MLFPSDRFLLDAPALPGNRLPATQHVSIYSRSPAHGSVVEVAFSRTAPRCAVRCRRP